MYLFIYLFIVFAILFICIYLFNVNSNSSIFFYSSFYLGGEVFSSLEHSQIKTNRKYLYMYTVYLKDTFYSDVDPIFVSTLKTKTKQAICKHTVFLKYLF